MSEAKLPAVGYPQGYPKPAGTEEIYLSDASTGRLYCLSCGTTGEAGNSGYLPISWNDTYLPHWVSADGDRVFFDSASKLVAGDTNGAQDVYEWQLAGSQGCSEANAVDGGCLSDLSLGKSPNPNGEGFNASWLIGESESGDDVFIATRSQLVPEDQNEAFDLYDARVGGERPAEAGAASSGGRSIPAAPRYTAPATGTSSAPPKANTCKKGFVKKHDRCVRKQQKKKKNRRHTHKHGAKKKKDRGAGADQGGRQ
jgi:hypothetical protein